MQTTWKSFSNLYQAVNGTRGGTKQSLTLVQENLYVGEKVEWVATAAVNDIGEWQDGSVVLTDQRIIVSYTHSYLQDIFANVVARVPIPKVSRFQGEGDLATFAIEGLPIQSIALDPLHLEEFLKRMKETDISGFETAASGSVDADPTATLLKLKEMLDAGLLTQSEFDAKKAEVLSRM